ncbi:uncharacterized protein LOC110098703, partial [Dendrobium catenatum]|uniref:uncharacterized protein LOC110098703 n=1 Tax=Dendrobium catenatum TaxID=906689 RepID=UPI0010A0A351
MYNGSSPLSTWLLHKYNSPWKLPHSNASIFWKQICKTALEAKQQFSFTITRNAPISLLWDHWCHHLPLHDYLGDAYVGDISDCCISELISGGFWDFPVHFPTLLQQACLSVNIAEHEGPCLLWKNKCQAKFNQYMEEFYTDMPDCNWYKLIWHKKHILKHSVFVWQGLMGGLKTADALFIRHIQVPATCNLCHSHDESISHLFFECNYSFAILLGIIPGTRNYLLRPSIMQLSDWIVAVFEKKSEVYGCLPPIRIATGSQTFILLVSSVLGTAAGSWTQYNGCLGQSILEPLQAVLPVHAHLFTTFSSQMRQKLI